MAHSDNGHRQNSSSNTSGSIVSDLSILDSDDYSDESQRRLLRHARDKKRMRNALGDDGRVVAFRKARPRPRIVSRLDNGTSRDEDVDGSNNGGSRRASLDSLHDLTNLHERATSFSPNIPQQWATKGRQRNNFLRRINSDSPVEQPRTPEQDPDIIYRRRTAFTGDSPRSAIDWTAGGADIPRQTIEPDSPSRLRRSPMYESLRRRRASRALSGGDLTELEPAPEPLAGDRVEAPNAPFDRQDRSPAAAFSRRSCRVPSTHVSTDYIEASRPTDDALKSYGAGARDPYWPVPHGKGSRELLRQLANRSSASPTSVSRSPRQSDARRPSTSPNMVDHGSAQTRATAPNITQASNVEPVTQLQQALQPSVMEGKKPTATVPDHRLPTPPEDEVLYRESKKGAAMPPIVAGRTESARASKQPLQHSEITHDELKFGSERHETDYSKPLSQRPRSALEAVLQTREEDDYGDETIASLGRVIDDDATMDLSDLLPLDEETLNLINNVNVRMHRGEDIRQEERDQLKRMNESLKAARSGVRSASKGLKRVENQVEVADVRNAGHAECCERCGCSGSTTLSGILARALRSFRDQFYKRSRTGWTLTWLGVISAIILLWSMLEVTLCETYCQPLYAETMVGYGVDWDAPRMPYVTTTVLLKRPLQWALGPAWTVLYWIVMNMINTLLSSVGAGKSFFGSYDGFGEHNNVYAESFVDAVGIGQDEFL